MNVRIIAVAGAVVFTASVAAAQTTAPAAPRLEVDAGFGFLGGARVGTADANLRANDREQRPMRLFSTESRFARAPELHVRAGVPLRYPFVIEGALTISRPELTATVSDDFEGAPGLTIGERVDQYFVEGTVVYLLDRFTLRGLVPFAAGGGGYLRQLHEGQTVVEHGQVFHAGGGAKYPLLTRATGFVRRLGVRGDARAYFLWRGIAFENRPRPHVAHSGSVFIGLL